MTVWIQNGIRHYIPGPPDLAKYGRGDTLVIKGEMSELERATWAQSIGLFILRGGNA